jgi:nucleotide-binding universal stress UspA family protein
VLKPMYRKILLAADGSDASQRAVNEALKLATLVQGRVHAVYVVHKWGLAPYAGYLDPDALGRVLNEDGRLALEEVTQAMKVSNVPGEVEICETTGKSDAIPQCLQRCAEIQQADVIVMGTHGRHGVGRLALGSVAEGLLRISTCPVMVVRG